MDDAEPSRPFLKRQGFQLDGRSFRAQGVARVSGSRLQELFHPESLRLKRDQKAAAEEARRLFGKTFFTAQLRYYGIKFPSTSTVGQVRAQLEDAVKQGKCDVVPEAVVKLEAKMRQDIEADMCRWEEASRAWHAEKNRIKDEEFLQAGTPAQKAACDLTRFLNYYFLTDGKPDPSKTPEPLILYGFQNRSAIHNLAEKVPGLESCSGGKGDDRTVCIGWDRGKVWGMASRINRLAYKVQNEVKEAQWEEAMTMHRDFVSKAGGGKKGRKPKAKPFGLAMCAGSYLVQCKQISDEWPDNATDMFTLDIVQSRAGQDVVSAAWDFGMFEGTMLVSLSQDALEEAAHEQDCDSEDDSENDSEDDSHSHRKRKASSSQPASRQSKKAKTAKSDKPPHRVEFLLRGRENGEGEIFADPEAGHIEFLDDECHAFEGVVYEMSSVGSNVEFRGYKVASMPQRQPESWNSFSWNAHERERIGRW